MSAKNIQRSPLAHSEATLVRFILRTRSSKDFKDIKQLRSAPLRSCSRRSPPSPVAVLTPVLHPSRSHPPPTAIAIPTTIPTTMRRNTHRARPLTSTQIPALPIPMCIAIYIYVEYRYIPVRAIARRITGNRSPSLESRDISFFSNACFVACTDIPVLYRADSRVDATT